MSKRSGAADTEPVAKRQAGAGAGVGAAGDAAPATGGVVGVAAPTVSLTDPYPKAAFLSDFDALNVEFCDVVLPEYEMIPEAREWIREMTKYTVPGGKLNRGLTVVHATQTIRGADITKEQLEQAVVLGWCVEWLQACFLVADDIMDESITRRGAPCWYRKKSVGMIAINDSFILRSTLLVFVRRRFKDKEYYGRLLDLINETTLQTELGQLLDLTSAPLGGEVDLSRFTTQRHHLIVKYKTSFYSFYLPVAMAMLLCGITNPAEFAEARDILTEMGVYFQVQDDYLDCYGDEATIGKIGTDIQDNKCGWLIVQALDRVTPAQREMLATSYGRNDPECVARVKALYKELELEKLYHAYEKSSYEGLTARIDGFKGKTPPQVLKGLLEKIYGRGK